MVRDSVQLETAVNTITHEYLLEFTSEYGIIEMLCPELPGSGDRIVDFPEGKPTTQPPPPRGGGGCIFGCQLPQMLPPESLLLHQKKPQQQQVPAHGIDPSKIQLPCANCKAILNVPHGLLVSSMQNGTLPWSPSPSLCGGSQRGLMLLSWSIFLMFLVIDGMLVFYFVRVNSRYRLHFGMMNVGRPIHGICMWKYRLSLKNDMPLRDKSKQLLLPYCKTVELKRFDGSRAGIDGQNWLHQATFS
nr:protein FORGETTER 1 [Tanacetum cinerariifolium]